ncbi:YjeF N-terminal domain-like protein [Morchella conica CCBAS932]|uniref:NAD(P)H-hydrate epimerase n=1 Tax=Morchella conica CCBAS932 TaxID=1392247 RepID=A0A3N4KHI5_9PEZI|nr:YjeF N-terminal domain-like protein [Morchella conica CCBAS932]
MALRQTLTAKRAAALDKELMSTGGFSLDQLMELAGLAVAQAIYKTHPPSTHPRLLIACGPGNNGGDGLVAARHLHLFSYKPTVYYPKPSKGEHFTRLTTQLHSLHIPFTTDFRTALKDTDHVVDALFGFSFDPSGGIRAPFDDAIKAMSEAGVGVTSVDVPSGWGVDEGEGELKPDVLVSLTAPKGVVRGFRGRHFIGGRFVGEELARRWGVGVPPYEGTDQVVEAPVGDVVVVDGEEAEQGREKL